MIRAMRNAILEILCHLSSIFSEEIYWLMYKNDNKISNIIFKALKRKKKLKYLGI
jgi:hypothetical protein